MKIPEGFEFSCDNCAWMQKVAVPEEKKKDYPHSRGYCTFNPPAVFPMPSPKQTKIAAMGQQPQMEMLPFMLRPVVNGNEPPCGRYSPDTETMALLGEGEAKDPCEDCKCKEGECGTK